MKYGFLPSSKLLLVIDYFLFIFSKIPNWWECDGLAMKSTKGFTHKIYSPILKIFTFDFALSKQTPKSLEPVIFENGNQTYMGIVLEWYCSICLVLKL